MAAAESSWTMASSSRSSGLMICPRCGERHDVPEVDPAESVVVCGACGHRDPFRRLPLFVLTGASGTGKSTVGRLVLDRYCSPRSVISPWSAAAINSASGCGPDPRGGSGRRSGSPRWSSSTTGSGTTRRTPSRPWICSIRQAGLPHKPQMTWRPGSHAA